MSGLGEELRKAREARRLSLADVSEQIHIRSLYLQALEDENWSAISAPVYVRGFLRTYARFLGLDGDAAVNRFSAAAGVPSIATPPVEAPPPVAPAPKARPLPPPKARTEAKPRPEPKSRPEPKARREARSAANRPSIFVWIAAAAAGVLVAFVGYNYYELQTGGHAKVVASDTRVVPSAAPTHPPTAAPTKPPLRTLALRVTQRSWIHVDIDGKPALEGIFDKGWAKEFHGDSASVSVGNAGGVDVQVNGREQGPMGADGDVIEKKYPLSGEDNGRG